jgi:phage terminase small subunit
MQTSKLTTKQAKWVDEYLACGNASASAVKAGFSTRGAGVAGNRMLKNANVQKALQARQAADATRLSIQREDVLNGLVEAAAMAKLQCDPAGMVAAWKQVGHLMGYYSPERIKVDVNVAGSLEMGRMNQLSDAELLKIIEAGQAVEYPQ